MPEAPGLAYTPAFSPDGRTIAYSRMKPGGYRDIHLYDLTAGTDRALTVDRAMDVDPRFTPDGRYLLWASDRTGIYDVYAYELATAQLYQVTNVLTGAFQPTVSTDGSQLRLKGQGGHGSRKDLNGDLFLTIRIAAHPVFTVSERDVRCQLPVWDYEAALGAEVTAPTIDGKIALKIPVGSQTGRVMRLRGRGLPARGKDSAGDLLFELKVLAPTDLTDDERALMEQLAESRRARNVPDPRAELTRS
jgi:dipeptidyl aminopeptidase/acylaminoacyl peptidase